MLKGTPGFVYVLFEHKSYFDRYVHLQLLEYMVKIWRLTIKQQKQGRQACLPVVIPLLICHGKRPWPENTQRLSSLLKGPVKELSNYIPDFGFELYDLARFTDEQIKGTIMARVVQLLFKYVFDPGLQKKLPDILSLMKTLLEKDTGLQYFETILRYLFSTMDNISAETIKEIAEKALSKQEGEYIMTLAEKLRQEGKAEGKIEGKIEGKQEGLRDAIELGMTLKFPGHMDEVMEQVANLSDLEALKKIKDAIKTVTDASQILLLINKAS
jgi:predicted transposase YdaD